MRATAYPTKAFFVRMITRDIALEDSILDLIDNSVDGAWRMAGSRPSGLATGVDLSTFVVRVDTQGGRFSIRDNCGGMTLEDAIEHAFSFGRQATDELDEYSIGVYGIGMKRAIFKLGSRILITSTYLDDDRRVSFQVPINVGDWVQSDAPPWDFDINSASDLPENGVEIEVTDLNKGALAAFANPAFGQELKRMIARDYSLHLANGLQIFLDGERINGWPISLRESNEFKPYRYQYVDESEGEPVEVEILAGMAAEPPDDAGPTEDGDQGKRSGWYIACNGRIVLAADKTAISGWGTDDWPQWHRQYDGFLGMVLFSSKKATALPLTTTKRSVDVTSEVYKRARPAMRDIAKSWIAYTNVRKQSLDDAKEKESKTRSVKIQNVVNNQVVALPALGVASTEKMANVSYSVPLVKLRKLATEVGGLTLSYRDVGLKSFEYAYDDLVGDE